MCQKWKFIFLIFFFKSVEFVKTQSCKEDLSSIKQLTIRWPPTYSSSSVISIPPCVNKNKSLVNRTCLNGQWFPNEYDCDSVQENFEPKCKDKDILDQSGYCLRITKPQHWTKDQPVVNVEDITDSIIMNSLFYILQDKKQFWLPVRRKEKYGKYMWTIPKYYGDKFLPYIPQLFYYSRNSTFKSEYTSYECMIVSNIIQYDQHQIGYLAEPRDCNDQYKTIHAYTPEFRYYTAKRGIYFSNNKNNAYFIQSNCQHLAEPKTKEENFIIKKLIKNQTCRIGIVKNKNNVFVWKYSNDIIKYTDWISSTNFSNSEVVITKEGWKLENQTAVINCSVCQIDHTKYKTKLELQPNKNHTRLILTQYSSMKILPVTLRTIGLEDVNLENPNMIPYNVHNDYKDVQNEFEKLNKRELWIINLNNTMSNYYYVESLLLPEGREIKTDKTYLLLKTSGREYAFKIKIKQFCNAANFYCDPHLTNYYLNISENILMQSNAALREYNSTIHKYSTSGNINNVINVTAMKIEKINNNGDLIILFHLTVNSTIVNITTEYFSVVNILQYLNEVHDNYDIPIDSIRSCMGCLPQTSQFDNQEIKWGFTEIGRIFSHANCLQANENLYIRKCGGDFIEGAKWDKPKRKKQNFSKYSEQFCNLYENRYDLTPQEAIQNLTKLTKTTDLKAIDIYYISEIVRNISNVAQQMNMTVSTNYKAIATNMSVVINNLVACNSSSLEESNMNTNSTNNFVADVEHYLPQIMENNLDDRGINTIVQQNLMFSIFDPFVSNITGLALIKPEFESKDLPFTQYKIKYLFANETINNIISQENIEIASFVPEQLLNDIRNKSTNKPVRISMFLFYNDSLFIENKVNSTNTTKTEILTRVLDVSIKGYDNYLFSPLPVISKLKKHTGSKELCAYWDFGSKIYNVTSKWKTENIQEVEYLTDKNIQICNFTHLTNFAMLLGKIVGDKPGSLTLKDNTNLEIITAVGALLSAFGICMIYLTALMFRVWRNKSKIMLNIATCILLQIILLYLNIKYDDTVCLITGSLLHYSVLCGFFWSLVMSFLEYLKFVKVVGRQTSHLLLKSSIVGWGLPLIPVIIAITYNYVTIGKYKPNLKNLGLNLCYPEGNMLYWTLLLPVTIIVFANLVIFFVILYSISCRPKLRNTCSDKDILIHQIKLAIFLFFLLGLSWISGLISVIYDSNIFLYVFCLTATLQGFVLFIYSIILDRNTRALWTESFKFKEKLTRKPLQQQSVQVLDTNSSNLTKDASGMSLSEVSEMNIRAENVMQELKVTHRMGNSLKSRTTK